MDNVAIRKAVAPDATDAEWELYQQDCARLQVSPADKLLHFTKRGGRYVPIVGIDFMRRQAARTGEYAGCDEARCSGTVATDDYTVSSTGYRLVGGQRCPWTATARWAEYYPGPRAGAMWLKMPFVMLSKVSEALLLRKMFGDVLHGVYTHEEMAQAEKPEPPSGVDRLQAAIEALSPGAVVPITVQPASEAPPVTQAPLTVGPARTAHNEGVWPIGNKYKGVPLGDIPTSYLRWAVKNLSGPVQTLAHTTLAAREGEVEYGDYRLPMAWNTHE